MSKVRRDVHFFDGHGEGMFMHVHRMQNTYPCIDSGSYTTDSWTSEMTMNLLKKVTRVTSTSVKVVPQCVHEPQ